MGFYYGFGSFARGGRWLNDTLAREPGSAGREHLISMLEERYGGDIKRLNTVYEKDYQSWDDLRQKGDITWPAGYLRYSDNPTIAADQRALLEEIIEKVHVLGHTEVRKVDSNHMILGCYVKAAPIPPSSGRDSSPTLTCWLPNTSVNPQDQTSGQKHRTSGAAQRPGVWQCLSEGASEIWQDT